MGTNEIVATSPVPRAPGEPAVLARLPEAVEYTYVKMILLSVLSPMYWFPWLDPNSTDPTWVRFGRGTFRAVDRLLRREEQRLAAAGHEVSTQAHDRVLYYDPVLTDAVTVAVVRRHFPEVMGQRIGQGWRSERAPEGWPMLTQKVIPALYDYLRPFYAARSYRKEHLFPTSGDYSTQLLQDITDILRLEMPPIAAFLTVERVQAAVQRYLAKARPDRRKGVDLFAP